MRNTPSKGTMFANLTCTGEHYIFNKRTMVHVTCQCGNTLHVRYSSLKAGTTQSCGECQPRNSVAEYKKVLGVSLSEWCQINDMAYSTVRHKLSTGQYTLETLLLIGRG